MPAPYCWGRVSGGLLCCAGYLCGLVMWWVEDERDHGAIARAPRITQVANRSRVTGSPW